MPSRRTPIGAGIRQSAVWPIALGVALGAVVASDPPRSFGERIGPLRPGPGRLIGIPYAPEGTPLSEAQRVALVAEIRRLSSGTDDLDHRTPESLRERAILALAQRDADGAVQLLEHALERLPADRPVHQEALLRSDLSAAHLQRFTQGDFPISSLAALNEAARATAGGFLGVRFNHAVALERLYLGRQAKRVWQDMAAANLEPGWASEATRHIGTSDAAQVGSQAEIDGLLARINQGDRQAAQELVRREPQRARELATRDALWDWADSIGRGENAAAETQLAIVELLSAPLADHGDRVAIDTIEILRAASPDQLEVAACGLRAYKEGFRLYRRFDHELGIAKLEAARRDLAKLKLPQELEVELYRAYLENNAGRAGARERVASVTARSAGRTYPGVEALVSWFEALIAGREGRPYDQAEAYRRTRAIYIRLGEAENQSSVEGLLAEALVKLGRRDDALEGYLAAAAIGPHLRDPYRRRLTWQLLTSKARRDGFLHAALAFQGETFRAAVEQGDPTASSEPLLVGASIRASLGDNEGATADLVAAKRLVISETDPEDRRRTWADIARIGVELPGKRDSRSALASLDRAISLYAGINQKISEMTARASRAQLRTQAKDLKGAEEDLDSIIAFARQGGVGWRASASDDARFAFGREVKTAFSAMVQFQVVEARNPWRAFTYQETVRELLAPRYQQSSGKPYSPVSEPNLARFRAELPSHVALLAIRLTEDRVISWLLMPEGLATFECPVDQNEVERLVDRLAPQKGLTRNAWKETSARLFDLLIRQVIDQLGPKRTLVVVPDGVLARVPWLGLWDRKQEEYLVMSRDIVVDPSATFYLKALARSRELGPMPRVVQAVIVGDPAFDEKEWVRFKRLPGARKEAMQLAAMYGEESIVLTGASATWTAFEKAAQSANVIHLGMHSVIDPADLFRSLFLFADAGASGGRSMRDLASLRLPSAHIAVLASCESTGGYEDEGVAGLARPFLAAGVDTVVGTLWQIEDRYARDLSVKLHRRILRREPLLGAIREEDAEQGRSGPPPWAGMLLVGKGS